MLNPIKSSFSLGNLCSPAFLILYCSNHKDILCCAKSFYFNKMILKTLTLMDLI